MSDWCPNLSDTITLSNQRNEDESIVGKAILHRCLKLFVPLTEKRIIFFFLFAKNSHLPKTFRNSAQISETWCKFLDAPETQNFGAQAVLKKIYCSDSKLQRMKKMLFWVHPGSGYIEGNYFIDLLIRGQIKRAIISGLGIKNYTVLIFYCCLK